MKIAIIPARGGSKRIPRKNIKPFCGKPMIAWPIAAAQDSGCFDRIIVSTDDNEIAQIALAHGAEVPFERPHELSDDHTGTIPVIAHAIRWMSNNIAPHRLRLLHLRHGPFCSIRRPTAWIRCLGEQWRRLRFCRQQVYAFPIQSRHSHHG